MRTRDKLIQIWVTETEKKRILRNAKRCRLTVSDYLRALAEGHDPAEYPSDLYWLCFEVELLMAEYHDHHNGKFEQYLKAFLDDIRSVLFANGGDN